MPITWTKNESFVEEGPRLGAVEPAHAHRGDQRGIEVAEVDAVLRAGLRIKRLPMRDDAARAAMDRPQRAVAPDVFGGGLGMAFDLDRAEFEVDPRTADAAAEGAVAGGGDLGGCGKVRRTAPQWQEPWCMWTSVT